MAQPKKQKKDETRSDQSDIPSLETAIERTFARDEPHAGRALEAHSSASTQSLLSLKQEEPTPLTRKDRSDLPDTWTPPDDRVVRFFKPLMERTPIGELPRGLYIVRSGTATGKTVAMAALHYYFTWAGVSSMYVPLAEPRAPEHQSDLASEENVGNFLDFFAGKKTPRGAAQVLAGIAGKDPFSRLVGGDSVRARVLFFDSLGYVMQRYMAEARLKMPAMQGGFSSADIAFARDFQDYARSSGPTGAVVFGVFNTDDAPFVERLLGRVEGDVIVDSISTFRIRFRGKNEGFGRSYRSVSVPPAFVRAALNTLDYGDQAALSPLASSSSTYISAR